ncbi:MAG: T9SS type A sorting domain-containing protein [Saprospiraceae bacterium]|nr:T9SS type A sorting domain-containing protein [Saprospiraceae bacterium]
MKTLLRSLLLLVMLGFLQPAQAVLPDGSHAEDFTVTDLNGQTWNLYTLLDQGKTVYIEFSATWCGPCWNYHSAGHTENLWNSYGPNGTDEVFVIFIEADLNTNTNCLYGSAGCNNSTQGDWVTGTPFPITDLNSGNVGIKYDYQITYYPTIYSICPQTKTVYEAGQRSAGGHYEYVTSCAMTYDLVNTINATCNGYEDGSIDIEPVGGYYPYYYEWSNGKTTQDVSDLPAGTYTCTIKDKNQVEIETIEITIDEPTSIEVSADQITIESCPGYGDGAIDISSSGGAGGYGYQWSNGYSQEDLQDLSTGDYSVIVTDSDGCFTEEIYNVGVNPAPESDAGDDGFLSCVETIATLDGTNSEGFGVSYQWSTPNGNILSGANSPVCDVDQPGDYFLLVTFNATGCFSEDQTLVQQDIQAPATNAGDDGLLNCAISRDTLDGSQSANGNGFTYLWETVDGNIVSGASSPYPVVDQAGTYTLTVTNEVTGCTNSDDAEVVYDNGPSAPEADYTFVAAKQKVTFTNASSGEPETYLWNFGDGNTSTEMSPIHNYAAAGDYEVCLVVTNACGEDTKCYTLTVVAPTVSVTASVTNATCNHNTSDGGVDLSVAGGVPPYTYLWSNGSTAEDLADIPAGTYTVVVTDANGEEETIDVIVGSTYQVNIDEALETNPLCFGDQNGAISLNASSSGGALTFEWSHDPNLSGSVANDLAAGTYTVIATDPNNCSDVISVDLGQPNALLGEVSVEHASPGMNDGSASTNPTGGTEPYQINWSTGETGNTINNLAPGDYSVSVLDANGCLTVEDFTVQEVTAIRDIASLTSFSLYPNPASHQIQLDMTFNQSEDLQIRMINLIGAEVMNRKVSGTHVQETMNLDQIIPGTYFLEIRAKEGQMIQRVIVE